MHRRRGMAFAVGCCPARALEIVKVDRYCCSGRGQSCLCFHRWAADRANATEMMGDDGPAAAAVDVDLVEVCDNIQNLCYLTAPYPKMTWPSRGERRHGPSAHPLTQCEMYHYHRLLRRCRRRRNHHHCQYHHHRAASPAMMRSCDIETCH